MIAINYIFNIIKLKNKQIEKNKDKIYISKESIKENNKNKDKKKYVN